MRLLHGPLDPLQHKRRGHVLLAATSAMPLMDDALARFDEAIGFDWVAWVGFVRGHTALNAVLRVAYDSLMVQLFGSIIVYRPRLVGHLVPAYAARAAVESWSCRMALGGLDPWRPRRRAGR